LAEPLHKRTCVAEPDGAGDGEFPGDDEAEMSVPVENGDAERDGQQRHADGEQAEVDVVELDDGGQQGEGAVEALAAEIAEPKQVHQR
jgi:hypothetical protein